MLEHVSTYLYTPIDKEMIGDMQYVSSVDFQVDGIKSFSFLKGIHQHEGVFFVW